MRSHRIVAVEVLRHPVVLVAFDDGFSGEYDLTEVIHRGQVFAPLNDDGYYRTVAVASDGRCFGWNLDEIGHEIDFCPDATRIAVETKAVEGLAEQWRVRRVAAE